MSQKPRQRPTVLDFAVVKLNQVLFHQPVSNDKKGISQFLKELRKLTNAPFKACLFCMEHTGIYNNPLLKALHQVSAPIWVERAAHIQESMGLTREKRTRLMPNRSAGAALLYLPTKTGRAACADEARLLAPPRAVTTQLDRLTAQRARLVKV